MLYHRNSIQTILKSTLMTAHSVIFGKKNIYRHLSVRKRKGRICAPHALPYKMYGIVNNHKNIRKSFIYHPAFGIINR